MENKMAEKEKDGNYALNTLKDIWKYDPMRLLDLGNDFQVLMSQNKPEVDEEARAASNFEKLVEDEPRPFSHTMVDATGRLLPIIASALGSAAIKGIGKGAKAIGRGISKATGKSLSKKATKDVAWRLMHEKSSDAAKAFSNSKFLTTNAKRNAGNKWARELLEDEKAMERMARKVTGKTNKKLSDEEATAIRKSIKKLAPDRIKEYNTDADKLYDVYKKLGIKKGSFETKDELIEYLTKNKKSLTDTEYKNLLENIKALPEAKVRQQRLDSLSELKEGNNVLRNIREGVLQYSTPGVLLAEGEKPIEALGNDLLKTKFQTNNNVVMKPNYYAEGSEPTPITDFIASVFDVDFDDPSRFNKKDIDAFFEFLEDFGTIEPGIKDKWTPRQKVSVMRELLKDKDLGEDTKRLWKLSEQRKNLKNSYGE